MNKWVRRSLEIANSPGYLDRLSDIYPADVLPRRSLPVNVKNVIRKFHSEQDSLNLLIKLFELTEQGYPFPIEHPYASLFRQKRKLMEKNPIIVRKLVDIILSMDTDEIIRGIERPIDLNRVMGQAFYNWLQTYFPNKGIPILPEDKFQEMNDRCFLDARNSKIQGFVNNILGYSLERGRDFLFKYGDKFVIGESRFLSTAGGSQTRDLIETIGFIKTFKGKFSAVGVLDGIIWYSRSYVNRLSELGSDEPAISVLLLDEFLDSL